MTTTYLVTFDRIGAIEHPHRLRLAEVGDDTHLRALIRAHVWPFLVSSEVDIWLSPTHLRGGINVGQFGAGHFVLSEVTS